LGKEILVKIKIKIPRYKERGVIKGIIPKMTKQNKEKNRKLQRQIIKILNDNEYYTPEMIIEEVKPFFWRMSRRWVKDKAERIVDLIVDVQNEKNK